MIDPHFLIPIAQAAEEAAKQDGIAGTFGIDWMKFLAQLINFAIILFILWKWVFTPVTKKLEERTAKIEKAMRDANTTEKEKQEFASWKQQETSKTRTEISEMINKAEKEAISVKDGILAQAKTEQEKIMLVAKQEIDTQKMQALLEVKSEVADLVVMATEKILKKKLDTKTDHDLIKDSLKSL